VCVCVCVCVRVCVCCVCITGVCRLGMLIQHNKYIVGAEFMGREVRPFCFTPRATTNEKSLAFIHIFMYIYTRMHCMYVHTCLSYVTRMNKSWHTHPWVISHIWVGHVIHTNDSCPISEWVTPRIWMCQAHIRMCNVSQMNELCHTYEWVRSFKELCLTLSLRGTIQISYLNVSCHTCKQVTSLLINASVPHEYAMSHSEWVTTHRWDSQISHVTEYMSHVMYE